MNNIEKFFEKKKNIIKNTRNEISEAVNNREFGEKAEAGLHLENLLIETKNLIKDNLELKEDIYSWYKKAMIRRDREPIDDYRFYNHFFAGGSFERTFSFGNLKEGFIFGIEKYGVFIPTHFAPKTLVGGYKLIKDLGESKQIAVLMSITLDLRDTISKMRCWHSVDLTFLSKFRGREIDKTIVYNEHPDIQHLIWGLAYEYIQENDNRMKDDEDDDEDGNYDDYNDQQEGGDGYNDKNLGEEDFDPVD